MNETLTAIVLFAGITASTAGLFLLLLAVVLGFVALLLYWFWTLIWQPRRDVLLHKIKENPILSPIREHWWESEAVFNPAAYRDENRVYLLYRAMGSDGISRIGYASSRDGIHFDERLPYPIYSPTRDFGIPSRKRIYGPLSYNTATYPSGGGWGGCEDPRLVRIGDEMFMSFVAFDGWGFVRAAIASIQHEKFLKHEWDWKRPVFLSPPGEIQKNWVLFPEKIRGKYAILHSVSPEILVEYVDSLEDFDGTKFIEGSHRSGGRAGHWDNEVRGAGAPPIRTPYGWLLFYHANDRNDPGKYKVGVMLLDLADPTKILHRSNNPVLSPSEWYENDWKPGIVYASGAVVVGDDLIVYYGGGDKRIAAAKANLRDFLHKLLHDENPSLEPVKAS